MTVENLLFFAKQHIHSDHAKILLAKLLNKNPLELLNYLNLEVDDKTVETYKTYVKALEEGKISKLRYDDYCMFYEELAQQKKW